MRASCRLVCIRDQSVDLKVARLLGCLAFLGIAAAVVGFDGTSFLRLSFRLVEERDRSCSLFAARLGRFGDGAVAFGAVLAG